MTKKNPDPSIMEETTPNRRTGIAFPILLHR